MDADALAELRASAGVVRAGDGSINGARVEAEYRRILRQIEQIELQITDNATSDPIAGESGVSPRRVSESAADYFRRAQRTARAVATLTPSERGTCGRGAASPAPRRRVRRPVGRGGGFALD